MSPLEQIFATMELETPLNTNFVRPTDLARVWNPMETFNNRMSFTQVDANIEETKTLVGINNKPCSGKRRTIGIEVGDDRLDLCQRVKTLLAMLKVQSTVFKMKTSNEDTFINNKVFNLCEVTSVIPLGKCQNFDTARKVGKFDNLGFVDTAPFRTILAVSKESADHSSSSTGKATMLGYKIKNCRPDMKESLYRLNWFQDGYLRTTNSSDPKYLPRYIGGSECPPSFGNWVNSYLYTLCYKGGTYQRIYASALTEVQNAVTSLTSREQVTTHISNFLRMKQEYLWGTYDDKVVVPHSRLQIELGDGLPPPLLVGAESSGYINNVMDRLSATKLVINRSGAHREVERTNRVLKMLAGNLPVNISKAIFDTKRKAYKMKFGLALSANSAFQNLLNRKADLSDLNSLRNDYKFEISEFGQLKMKPELIKWASSGGFTLNHCIADLKQNEDYFVRSEIDIRTSMKVPGIPILITNFNIPTISDTVSRIGLYQISETMREWSEGKLRDMLLLRKNKGKPLVPEDLHQVCTTNLEWVNDDDGLVAKAIAASKIVRGNKILPTFYLVSNDNKLAQRICDTVSCILYRVNPEDVITHIPRVKWDAKTTIDPHEISKNIKKLTTFVEPDLVLYDSGSIMSAAQKVLPAQPGIHYKITDSKVYIGEGSLRTETYTMEQKATSPNIPYFCVQPKGTTKRTQSGANWLRAMSMVNDNQTP